MSEFWKNILAGIIATIIGGIILTFLLFVSDEWIFPKPNLTGEWVINTVTQTSNYKPFIGVGQSFKFELLQKDNDLIGSGEKVSEIELNHQIKEYPPEKRVRLEVSGYLERNYIKVSKVNLNIVEHGDRATSTTTFFLSFISKDSLAGTFMSTVSNTGGAVSFKRHLYPIKSI